jgi:GNAT superfamily N-acetyltransferase
MNHIVIKELTTTEELKESFPVMVQLRTHLNLETYLEQVERMRKEGYRLFALFDEGKIVALSGIILLTNLYDGRHIYVYDLVTDQGNRSKGYGETLLGFIHQLARELGCERVVLSSGFPRVDAHRFYEEKMGYQKNSYVFRKILSNS